MQSINIIKLLKNIYIYKILIFKNAEGVAKWAISSLLVQYKKVEFYGSQVGKAYRKPLYFAHYLTQKYDF